MSKQVKISLPYIILSYIIDIVKSSRNTTSLPYATFLTKLFRHFSIPLENEESNSDRTVFQSRSIKQMGIKSVTAKPKTKVSIKSLEKTVPKSQPSSPQNKVSPPKKITPVKPRSRRETKPSQKKPFFLEASSTIPENMVATSQGELQVDTPIACNALVSYQDPDIPDNQSLGEASQNPSVITKPAGETSQMIIMETEPSDNWDEIFKALEKGEILEEEVNVGVLGVDGKPLDDLNKEPTPDEDDEGSQDKEPSQEEERPLIIQPGSVIILEPQNIAEEPPKNEEQPSLEDIHEDLVVDNSNAVKDPLVPYTPEDEGIQGDNEMDQTQGEFDINVTPKPEEEIPEEPNQLSPISQAVHDICQDVTNETAPVNPPLFQGTTSEIMASMILSQLNQSSPQPQVNSTLPLIDNSALFAIWNSQPAQSPAKTGNTLTSENINRFITTPPSSMPKVKEPSDLKLPSDLPTHFSSLGSFGKTTFAPLSSSIKGQQSSKPSENKDDSYPSADRLESMEKSLKRMKAQQEKQMKKMRQMETNVTTNIQILQQEGRIEAQRRFAFQQWVTEHIFPLIAPSTPIPDFHPPQTLQDIPPPPEISSNSSDDSSPTK